MGCVKYIPFFVRYLFPLNLFFNLAYPDFLFIYSKYIFYNFYVSGTALGMPAIMLLTLSSKFTLLHSVVCRDVLLC